MLPPPVCIPLFWAASKKLLNEWLKNGSSGEILANAMPTGGDRPFPSSIECLFPTKQALSKAFDPKNWENPEIRTEAEKVLPTHLTVAADPKVGPCDNDLIRIAWLSFAGVSYGLMRRCGVVDFVTLGANQRKVCGACPNESIAIQFTT